MTASLKTSLQDQLDRITANTRTLVQPERLAISEKATAELFDSGIEDRILHPARRPQPSPSKTPAPASPFVPPTCSPSAH